MKDIGDYSWKDSRAVQNLELKVRCLDGTALQRIESLAASAGASYMHTLQQRDTYFPAEHAHLKLREWWRQSEEDRPATEEEEGPPELQHSYEKGAAGAVLISYVRPQKGGTTTSDYLIYRVDEPLMLRTLLSQALGVRAVVEKKRKIYQYGHTRIHLDEVQHLGAFVELETVINGAISLGEATAEHSAVISLLELDRLPVVPYSYSDLLVGHGE
jgi:adenylate cyclase class IV